jgi:hypothetical protein
LINNKRDQADGLFQNIPPPFPKDKRELKGRASAPLKQTRELARKTTRPAFSSPEKLKRTLSLDGQGNRELARFNNIPTLILGSGSSDLSQRWSVAMRHSPHKKQFLPQRFLKDVPVCVWIVSGQRDLFLENFRGFFCDEKAERTSQ